MLKRHNAIGQAEAPHRRHLDGLRGIAILMVLTIHTGLFVPDLPPRLFDLTFYGLHGVQLFFIVSGCTLVIAHWERPWSTADFLLRRFFRVAPMFYLGAAFYWLLGQFAAPAFFPTGAGWVDVVATLLFLHGWLPHGINKVVPGGWSVAAEAMFYLLFPALLALVARPRAFALVLVSVVGLAGATNLVLRHAFAGDPAADGFAFYFWVSQLPAFAIGCRLGRDVGLPRLSRPGARALFLAAAAGMIVDSQLRGHTNLLVAVALLGLLVWAAPSAQWGWLSGRVLPFLGRVSFSLYLLHFAVLQVVGLLLRRVPLAWWERLPLLYAALLALAVPLAWCGYRAIEQPGIALGRTLARRWHLVAQR